VCWILACFVFLVGAPVTDEVVSAGERLFAAGLVHSCLSPLSLPPSSCVAPPPSALTGVLTPKLLWGEAWFLICSYFYTSAEMEKRIASGVGSFPQNLSAKDDSSTVRYIDNLAQSSQQLQNLERRGQESRSN
jgi:hypothetical protein